MNSPVAPRSRWSDTWLDGLAFAFGLALAWWFRWNTTDLIWSLWLSSLVVGYALIVWLVTGPLRQLGAGIARDQSGLADLGSKAAALALVGVGTLFALAFFTVHFGGFHFVHSIFLQWFFPVTGTRSAMLDDWRVYLEVLSRYWMFLPAAFLAERHRFKLSHRRPDTSVTAEAIVARKAKGSIMMLPYKGVIRMHLLIFFFVFAHFMRLDSFAVYAVVYAVYFFPWHLIRRQQPAAAPELASP